ncbi:hypothetical protein CF651_11955 [Paenibacillus rigui]|uniref:Copper amine oxidase-like N-terminal domain-containing protein n=2 Tax=Paenibacillus rigui TaxID=554312 RepID=A0A229USR6_9BACL|nr:hypothetical protein CF651_11955 [Paenibacillus rigui]
MLIFLVLTCWLGLLTLDSQAGGGAPIAMYLSPEGIQFESYSSMWGEERLKGLYSTLLGCGHGVELSDLKKVILSPEKSTGKSGSRVGHYDKTTRTIRVFEVEAVPVERIFIHEYGHHFTYYWLHQKEGIYPDELMESNQWSQIRQLGGYPVRWQDSKLPYSHKWEPDEIMAEDYVLLFGVGIYPPPVSPKEVAYFLRQENDYIPMAETIPALRKYWEEAAGLEAKESLRVPRLLQWEHLVEEQISEEAAEGTDAVDEVSRRFRFQFSSVAVHEEQEIQYGIQLIGFSNQGGIPAKLGGGVVTTGRGAVEATLDLKPMKEELHSFYAQLQIWALDPQGKQFMYTPLHANWFEYNDDEQRLKPIPFPFERQRLPSLLQKEGMNHWPLVQLFINGKPITAVRRHDDQNGVLYIPVRVLNETEESEAPKPAAQSATVRFHQHEVQVQVNQDQVIVDGTAKPTQRKIQSMDGEPAISVQDVGQLFDVSIQWNEPDSALLLEAL